ncbi:hypothetical protein EOM39_03375 [Candidatus Gracilibacteria bacterium]|nr:hypothetical protein [Candidatus Gracilibacteria bacterium]
MNIHKLRGQIKGNAKCIDGCYQCCGAIIFAKEELKEMKKELLRKGLKEPPKGKGDGFCEYLDNNGKCSVYNQRPMICRIFGQVDTKFSKCEFIKNVKLIKETYDMKMYAKDVAIHGLFNDFTKNILLDKIKQDEKTN